MSDPTLDAVRYSPHFAWASGEYLEMQQVKNGEWVKFTDYTALLDRLAGSQNACNDNAKRMGLLIEQLNEAKDRLAAYQCKRAAWEARINELEDELSSHIDCESNKVRLAQADSLLKRHHDLIESKVPLTVMVITGEKLLTDTNEYLNAAQQALADAGKEKP